MYTDQLGQRGEEGDEAPDAAPERQEDEVLVVADPIIIINII